MNILIMGLPGSGKTWLGSRVAKHFSIPYFDADVVRAMYNDWDFSPNGRLNQTLRMKRLARIETNSICGFVCPIPEYRDALAPDEIVWMNTIEQSRFEDTNKLFVPPTNGVVITKWITEDQLSKCLEDFSHGTKDTASCLSELFPKLAKL